MEPNFNQGNPQLAMNFPNWNLDTAVDLNELGDVDYELLLKIQINILKVLIVLINNFTPIFFGFGQQEHINQITQIVQ